MPAVEKPVEKPYVHALRFAALTAWYDPLIALTTREKTFKTALLDAAALQTDDRILDVGCGTGTLAIQAKHRQPGAKVYGIDGDPASCGARHQRPKTRG